MPRNFEVRWEGELPAAPQQVWDGFTKHADGWLWPIEFEPRVGGAERGLTADGGVVTAWDPPRHFATRSCGPCEGGEGFNELDYLLEPRGTGTHLRYLHTGTFEEHEYEVQLHACELHTELYLHSLGTYARHFAGRQAAYVTATAGPASTSGGLAAVRRALGVPDGVAVGDQVRLTPAGLAPVDGVVDYLTDHFLGVRGADALYRVYDRGAWGWPVAVGHHLFAEGVDQETATKAWSGWLDGVFASEEEA